MMAYLLIGFLRLITPLPLPVVRAIGTGMGCLLYAFATKRRHIVQTNLRVCFPTMSEQERSIQTRAVFDYFGKAFVDRAWLWHGSKALLQKRLRLVGFEGQALSGAILFAPHLMGMDASWTALNRLTGHTYASIYAAQKNKLLDAWIKAGRIKSDAADPNPQAPLLIDHHAGVRPIVKALRGGAVLFSMPDMNYEPRDSLFPTFFGVPAATLPVLPRYAQLGGMPDQPCEVRSLRTRMMPEGYEITLQAVWDDYPSDDLAADTQRMNHELEKLILSSPDMHAQYYWVHKRFKDQPEGQTHPY